MVVELPNAYEERLRDLAGRQGRAVGLLIGEAVREYLEAAAITDLEPAAVGEAQVALAHELGDLPGWEGGRA